MRRLRFSSIHLSLVAPPSFDVAAAFAHVSGRRPDMRPTPKCTCSVSSALSLNVFLPRYTHNAGPSG